MVHTRGKHAQYCTRAEPCAGKSDTQLNEAHRLPTGAPNLTRHLTCTISQATVQIRFQRAARTFRTTPQVPGTSRTEKEPPSTAVFNLICRHVHQQWHLSFPFLRTLVWRVLNGHGLYQLAGDVDPPEAKTTEAAKLNSIDETVNSCTNEQRINDRTQE